MRKIRDLIRLNRAHLSHEQIARALAVSKGVVAKYVARLERLTEDPGGLLERPDAELDELVKPAARPRSYGGRIAPDFAHIHCELRRAGVTLTLLWEEYVAAHREAPTYRYTQFAELYRTYVASLRRSMRQVHRAGEKLFVDYAGQSVPYGREGDRAQGQNLAQPPQRDRAAHPRNLIDGALGPSGVADRSPCRDQAFPLEPLNRLIEASPFA